MLMQKDRINLELTKKFITEKKTTIPPLRNLDRKKVKVETEKVNKLLPNIPTSNVTELNKLIYAGVKLVCDKIGIPQRNPNKNIKPGWEIRLERKIKKPVTISKSTKERKT